jgi:hypothetical protein
MRSTPASGAGACKPPSCSTSGPVTQLPALNSFFRQPDGQQERQMADLRAWLSQQRPRGNIVLVSHQVNITALTGVFPDSGEMVVAKALADSDVQIVGRIPPP